MRNLKNIMCILLIGFVCLSCNKEVYEEDLADFEEEDTNLFEEISFTYEGKTYHSACEYVDDQIILLDEEAEAVLKKIELNPNLASVVDIEKQNHIYYYDSYEEVLKLYELENREIETKSFIITEFEVQFFENTKLKKHMWTTKTNSYFEANTPKRDKLSSFRCRVTVQGINYTKFYRTALTLFDLYGFGGTSITFIGHVEEMGYISSGNNNQYTNEGKIIQKNGTENYYEIGSLKNYRLSSSRNWNDEAASYSMRIIN